MPTVTLGSSSAGAADLIPFQQSGVTATEIPLSGQHNPTLSLTMEGRV